MPHNADIEALVQRAQQALERNDIAEAHALLDRAEKSAPLNPAVPLNLSFVFRAMADPVAEMDALTRALTIDAFYFPALLAKGAAFERTGNKPQAARTYKDALTIAPPPEKITREMQDSLAHAREIIAANSNEMESFLNERLRNARARHAGERLDRFQECQDVFLGRKQIFTQQPHLLHYPGLPAIQFYDRADFPWLAALEAATPMIRQELVDLLDEGAKEFVPYVRHPPWRPLRQWSELNHSPRWSAYFLWEEGEKVEEHCARCPRTAAALAHVPLCDVPGFAPAAFFSTLEPHTRIFAHTGVTNTRLAVHLPLIIPQECWFRVGNDKRQWPPGQAMVFDDTIDHEAWNGSDSLRAVLIFDIWNPYLTMAERELICELLNGARDYNEG